jgi:hypothetical protein
MANYSQPLRSLAGKTRIRVHVCSGEGNDDRTGLAKRGVLGNRSAVVAQRLGMALGRGLATRQKTLISETSGDTLKSSLTP